MSTFRVEYIDGYRQFLAKSIDSAFGGWKNPFENTRRKESKTTGNGPLGYKRKFGPLSLGSKIQMCRLVALRVEVVIFIYTYSHRFLL